MCGQRWSPLRVRCVIGRAVGDAGPYGCGASSGGPSGTPAPTGWCVIGRFVGRGDHTPPPLTGMLSSLGRRHVVMPPYGFLSVAFAFTGGRGRPPPLRRWCDYRAGRRGRRPLRMFTKGCSRFRYRIFNRTYIIDKISPFVKFPKNVCNCLHLRAAYDMM